MCIRDRPYTVNKQGHGPAWQNSLFEDNAEFGLGMTLAQNAIRGRLEQLTNELVAEEGASEELKAACLLYTSAERYPRFRSLRCYPRSEHLR